MQYVLGNMLNGAGGLNADGLSLDLQFAADKTLSARKGPTPVFTRASTATFVGSNGLIQSAAINEARFDHDPVTLACKGLLIEEGRTNVCLSSENFGTTWSTFNSSTSLISQVAPNGDPSAYSLVENTSTTQHSIFQSIAFAGTTNYTFSVFVKAGSRNFASLVEQSSGGTIRRTFFNLSTGEVGTKNASHTASTQQLPNGWWRLIISFTSGSAASANIAIELASADNVSSYLGNGSGNAFLWGAQVEAGSFPTSYIPTTTGTLARGADVCSITGSNFNNFYNQSEGTFLSSTQLFSVGNDYFASYWNVFNTPSYMRVSVYSQTSTQEASYLQNNDGTLYSIVASELSRISRTAGAYQLNNARIVKNGTLGVLDTTFTPYSNLISLTIMSQASGTINSLRYYRKRLPDAKLQALTV
jgi:hypothetical protein